MKRNKKQKKIKGLKPEGKSKYAKKVARRKMAAKRLGLPSNTPWPIIWANMWDDRK